MAKILITGIAGFIGFHLAQRLQDEGHEVFGFDNFNDYYDVKLKRTRQHLLKEKGINCYLADLTELWSLSVCFDKQRPDIVIHLAAYAGVRHSYDNQVLYINNNIMGTQNLIDVCERYNVNKIIYASTSCVMAGQELPWKEDQPTFHQMNPYGYSKRTNECQFLMSKIEQTIGLRFFTVYGPWGRPDMALFTFTNAILKDTPIDVYNFGKMKRDFTFIDDIVQGITIVVKEINQASDSMNDIYNIGNGQQVELLDFISEIEKNLEKKAIKNYLPKHPADTLETWSDTTKLQQLGYNPTTPISEGVRHFIDWYKNYYEI